MLSPRAASSPRGPALVYLALTAALVVLVAALAFTTRQPPPPQIAELTPQAQHEITKAPSQLSGSTGTAAGAPGAAAATTTSTSRPAQGAPAAPGSPQAVQVTAVHHCYGNPPRQTQDTQSPPCVAYWAGSNGGATAPGVSATTITVVVFNNGGSDTNQQRVYQDLESFFNRYFELYGRDIVLRAYNEQGGTCAQAASEADGVAAQYRPFAVADDNASPSETCAYAAMARDRVIVGTQQPWFTRANMEADAPWLWEYPMAPDDVFAGTGAFVCSQLAGRDAVWSPDPLMQGTRRKFGLIYEYDETPFPNDSVGALDRALARCGVTLADQAVYMDTEDSNADPQEFYTTAVAQMKADGVTTVLTALEGNYEYVPAAADADNYYPEWLRVPTYPFNQFTENVLWPEADQRVGLLGLWDEPDHVPYDEATLNWALQAVDPGFQEDYNYVEYEVYQQLYWSLLLIASGIQMAGPDLTPDSFQRGLELARFPNPPSPEQEGAAGFDQGSHAMTEDFAAMWYSNSAPNPYPEANGTGAWCYADGGRRFTPATWGALVGYHQGPCDSSPPGS